MTSIGQAKIISDFVGVILKDLYSSGKGAASFSYSKWNNKRNIAKLIVKIRNFEKVKTIWQREKEVSLSSVYYPSKLLMDNESEKPMSVNSLIDIPQDRSYVIEGTVGQGKSFFLRYLCIQELGMMSSNRIPVFIELRKLDTSYGLINAVYDCFKNLGFEIDDRLFEFYAKSGKIIFLFDGFDEIEESLVRVTVNQLENYVERYPQSQFIITSRPYSDISKSRHFSICKLAPLTEKDFRPFMSKIGVKGKTAVNIVSAIKNSTSEVSGLLKTPLLLTLLVLVYQTEQEIPRELPDFFEKLFTTVFTRHDRSKPGFIRKHRSGLNENRFEMLFEAFCFYILRNNCSVSMSKEGFSKSYGQAKEFMGEACDEIDFKHDLVKVACLMQEDGYDMVFVHKSLLDYFSAAFVKRLSDARAEIFYTNIIDKFHSYKAYHIWRSTLFYLAKIDKYRYTKFYTIPSLDFVFKQFEITEYKLNKLNVESAFAFIFQNAQIRYICNEGYYKLVSLNFGVNNHCFQKLEGVCASVAFALYKDKVKELSELSEIYDVAPVKHEDDSYGVMTYNYTDKSSQKNEFLNTLKICLSNMIEIHRAGVDFISTEDEKNALIFSDF